MDIQKLFYKEEETNEKIRSEFRELNCSIDKEDQKLREKFENWFAKTFVKDNEEISGLLIIVNLDSKSITNKKATLYLCRERKPPPLGGG